MDTPDDIAVKLTGLLTQIRACIDRNQAGTHWKAVFTLLKKTDVPPNKTANIVAGRNTAELEKICRTLTAGDSAGGPAPGSEFDEETLKTALKLFRRRLKFTRLDEESRLGVGPIGGGHRKKITSIHQPPEYPTAIWHELVRQGKLRQAGKEFYELVGDDVED